MVSLSGSGPLKFFHHGTLKGRTSNLPPPSPLPPALPHYYKTGGKVQSQSHVENLFEVCCFLLKIYVNLVLYLLFISL